jgi:putative transposase
MYDYRKWTPEQQQAAVTERKQRGYPWHSPPHLDEPDRFHIITGSCHDHTPLLDTDTRLAWFETELLDHIKAQELSCAAWVVLPNHYHILVKIGDIKQFTRKQGQLHGRTSFEINRDDNKVGRKVWYRCMRSEAHYYTTLNYIHNKPVKHGYVKKWGDWP